MSGRRFLATLCLAALLGGCIPARPTPVPDAPANGEELLFAQALAQLPDGPSAALAELERHHPQSPATARAHALAEAFAKLQQQNAQLRRENSRCRQERDRLAADLLQLREDLDNLRKLVVEMEKRRR